MKAQCLPFSQIPHTTRLFADFLAGSSNVQQFYPNSPNIGQWLQKLPTHYDSARRKAVAAILERQNNSWNASARTTENIRRLRNGAAAIVTGQQVGLFGGPMFAIYKALSAVKLAEQATENGIDVVPIFWLATYDHDLAEVSTVALPGPEGGLQTLQISSQAAPGTPVSAVRLGDEIVPVVDRAISLLGESDASRILRDCYRPGETLGSAFARFYSELFAEWGVILLDASDPELHQIAKPIYRAAIEQSGTLADRLLSRGGELEAAGYHQQVKVTESSVLVFVLQDGVRTAIQRREDGNRSEFYIGAEASAEKLSQDELLSRIENQPELFSPNVLLRPVVQDYLLPTMAYTGGAAEVAYFAQANVIYDRLLGHVTPIVPRYSATLVDSKAQRLLEKHGVTLIDVLAGPDALKQKLAARSLPEDLQAAFDTAGKSLERTMAIIQEKLGKLDRTLMDAAQTATSKMQYQIERLHIQAGRAELRQADVIARHAETLSESLYPNKGLQERTIGGVHFVSRYGRELLQQIYSTIHIDCHDHQIVDL